MHHALRLYSKHREKVLHFYMFWAKWTRIPVIGRIVRWVANTYGMRMENAYILTTAEACEIIDISSKIYLGPCTCREVFKKCDNPVMAEIMISSHNHVFVDERKEDYRELTGEEAKEILRQCHDKGLMHTVINCRKDYYALCNCCSCCCVPYRLSKNYGIGNALVRHHDIVGMVKEHIKVHE